MDSPKTSTNLNESIDLTEEVNAANDDLSPVEYEQSSLRKVS